MSGGSVVNLHIKNHRKKELLSSMLTHLGNLKVKCGMLFYCIDDEYITNTFREINTDNKKKYSRTCHTRTLYCIAKLLKCNHSLLSVYV